MQKDGGRNSDLWLILCWRWTQKSDEAISTSREASLRVAFINLTESFPKYSPTFQERWKLAENRREVKVKETNRDRMEIRRCRLKTCS